MLLKTVVLAILATIIYCLGSAMYYLIRQNQNPIQMAKALTWRIGLSVALFILLIVSYFMGWIVPHSIIAGG